MPLTQSVFHQSRRRAVCDGFVAEDADISGAPRRRLCHSLSAKHVRRSPYTSIGDSNPSYDIVNRIFENAGNFRQTGVQLTASQEIARAWRMTGSVNWFQNDVEALDTILFFPTRRPFTLSGSKDHTWDMTLNNAGRDLALRLRF